MDELTECRTSLRMRRNCQSDADQRLRTTDPCSDDRSMNPVTDRSGRSSSARMPKLRRGIACRGSPLPRVSRRDTTHTDTLGRSTHERSDDSAEAPFYGSKVVEITDLTKVFDFINETALFKGQWQYKQGRKSNGRIRRLLDEDRLSEVCRDKGAGDPRKAARGQARLRLFSVSVARERPDHLSGRRKHRADAIHFSASAASSSVAARIFV